MEQNTLEPQTLKSQMALKYFLNKLLEFRVKFAQENLLMETENSKCLLETIWHQHRLFPFFFYTAELGTLLKIFAFKKVTAVPPVVLRKSQHLIFHIILSVE